MRPASTKQEFLSAETFAGRTADLRTSSQPRGSVLVFKAGMRGTTIGRLRGRQPLVGGILWPGACFLCAEWLRG